MLVIHWSQARYGSLKIKTRKRPGLNAMTYSSMENWADYWCVGRCVHFIIPACSYSSFHKGCGLCFSTFSWIYQQIYLLLLPASVYIQWASWAWSVWGFDWLMAVFVMHGFIGLNLTFRCLWLQYLHLEMCSFWMWVFIFLFLFIFCCLLDNVLSSFYKL